MARNHPLARSIPLAAKSLPLRPHVPVRRSDARRAAALTAAASNDADLLAAAVDWGLYVDGRRTDEDDLRTACRAARGGDGFIWLGLHEPGAVQLAELGRLFDLHELALEDASNVRQRPKIERYDDALFLAMRTLAYIDRDERSGDDLDGGDIVETGTVVVFVGEYFAITVRHGRHASMRGLRRRLEQNRAQLALGPSAVLHAVCDKVVDDYLAVVDQVNEDIEEIETTVFSQRRIDNVERIYQLKRDIIEMKRTVSPLVTPLHELANRSQRAGPPRHPRVLPGRRGPPDPGPRAGAELRRAARVDPAGRPGPADGERERGHAQDLGLGGDRRRPDHDRRDVRDELRPHAPVEQPVGLPGGHER